MLRNNALLLEKVTEEHNSRWCAQVLGEHQHTL